MIFLPSRSSCWMFAIGQVCVHIKYVSTGKAYWLDATTFAWSGNGLDQIIDSFYYYCYYYYYHHHHHHHHHWRLYHPLRLLTWFARILHWYWHFLFLNILLKFCVQRFIVIPFYFILLQFYGNKLSDGHNNDKKKATRTICKRVIATPYKNKSPYYDTKCKKIYICKKILPVAITLL